LLVSEKICYQIPEAVEVSGLGRTTLYREIAAGRLETVVVGRRRLVPRAALEDYIARLRSEQSAGDAA
jgi:excisionase family DNA binding protein